MESFITNIIGEVFFRILTSYGVLFEMGEFEGSLIATSFVVCAMLSMFNTLPRITTTIFNLGFTYLIAWIITAFVCIFIYGVSSDWPIVGYTVSFILITFFIIVTGYMLSFSLVTLYKGNNDQLIDWFQPKRSNGIKFYTH